MALTVFVIVLFTSFTGFAAGGSFETAGLLRIPVSILLGIGAGAGLGYVLHRFLSKIHLNAEKTLILFLSVCFLLVTVEDMVNSTIGFSGLIAVMAMGMMFAAKSASEAADVSKGLSKLWTAAEILLFVLVGAAVDISYAFHSGITAVLLVFTVLIFRMLGVAVCVSGTKLSFRERLFCMIAYTPKATVQAAIGAIPLSMGLSCGNTVLTVAVIAILVTAPLGAFMIDLTYRRFLSL